MMHTLYFLLSHFRLYSLSCSQHFSSDPFSSFQPSPAHFFYDSLSLFLIVAICSLLDFSIYTLIFSTSQTHIVNSIVLSRARHFLFLFSLLHHQKASIRYMVVFISTTTSTSTTLLLALFLQSNFHLLLYHLLFHLYRTSCFFVQAK